jgi:hypothetical protein
MLVKILNEPRICDNPHFSRTMTKHLIKKNCTNTTEDLNKTKYERKVSKKDVKQE